MVFTPEQKIKIVQFGTKPNHTSQSAAYSVMNLNSYHVMHPAASSSSSLCSTWIARVPCTLHNTHEPFSGHHVPGLHGCRARVSRRKSQKILTPPFTGVGTLSHSSPCRCLFTPRGYYVREKLQLSNHQYDALICDGRAGEGAPSFEGGVHMRTCRCTPHLTCVSLSSNGSLATQQVWTQSAQPFARYGRGVCTCARADALYLRHV